jgi:hypothetical protein
MNFEILPDFFNGTSFCPVILGRFDSLVLVTTYCYVILTVLLKGSGLCSVILDVLYFTRLL